MIKFVVDTNVLVSSILIRKSSSDAALKKARNLGKLLFSEATFQELQTVLNRSKFDKYVSLTIRSEFMFRLKLESELIEIIEQVNLCRDLKDNQFLEVAMNGNADYLITGDQDLLVLRPFQEIQIMTVHEFLSEQ